MTFWTEMCPAGWTINSAVATFFTTIIIIYYHHRHHQNYILIVKMKNRGGREQEKEDLVTESTRKQVGPTRHAYSSVQECYVHARESPYARAPPRLRISSSVAIETSSLHFLVSNPYPKDRWGTTGDS